MSLCRCSKASDLKIPQTVKRMVHLKILKQNLSLFQLVKDLIYFANGARKNGYEVNTFLLCDDVMIKINKRLLKFVLRKVIKAKYISNLKEKNFTYILQKKTI